MAAVRPDPQVFTTAGVFCGMSVTPTSAKTSLSSSCRVSMQSGLARVRLDSTDPRTQGSVRSQHISEGHAARAWQACMAVRELGPFMAALDSIATRDVSSSHARAWLWSCAQESTVRPRVQQGPKTRAETDTNDMLAEMNWIARTNATNQNPRENAESTTCRSPSIRTHPAVPTASTCA